MLFRSSEANGVWVKELLNYYDDRSFMKNNNELDTTSNTFIITQMMKEKGFIMNNSFQDKKGYVCFYPNDFFCPKSYKTGKIELTENSYCIHHFAKSWIPFYQKWKNIAKMKFMYWFGVKNIQSIIDFIKK